MICLARMLIREKLRRMLAQYGWAGCAGLAVMLSVFALATAAAAGHLAQNAGQAQISTVMNRLWLTWIFLGAVLGKDLSWQIRLERLLIFPLEGFLRFYVLGLLLGFLSFPLILGLLVFEVVAFMASPLSLAGPAAVLVAYVMFVASVRLLASWVRALLRPGSLSSPLLGTGLALGLFAIMAWIALSFFCPGLETPLPGHQFGLILTGADLARPLSFLCGLVLLLSFPGFLIQRSMTRSGMNGLPGSKSRGLPRGVLMLLHPAWPTPLWRISLLGWLRNRNAVMMLVFGSLYFFFFAYFTKPDEMFGFYAFCWVALIYHAYLRGNLLGVDHQGVWLYYMLPVPVHGAIRAKNHTLSLLQGCLLVSVLLPALFHPVRGTDCASWLCAFSYAYSSLLVGEIAGSVFSLRNPEPIERSSHFSGGMTAGALLIPLIQLLFVLAFTAACATVRRLTPSAGLGLLLIGVPGLLLSVRALVLPCWIRRIMLKDREILISKLRVFSP
jgi:hypothetical protein